MKFDLHEAMLKENAQLRKSLAATQAELEKARQLAEDRLQQMQADRSQALGWKVDAERYRKLRLCDWFSSPLAVVRNPNKAVKLGQDCPSHGRLDEFVDELPSQTT